MDINTSLGITFSKFKDVIRYMEEEKINEIEISLDYFGLKIPKEKFSLQELKEYVKKEKLV